jgi:ubiquinone/menaquinone biosynthesis C-methylase UbiE
VKFILRKTLLAVSTNQNKHCNMNIKNRQGELWGTAAEDWALYLETTFIPVYKKVISKCRIGERHVILDVGCGSGLFIKMLGAKGALVHGIDLCDELLAIAKKRNPEAILLNQDMNYLPFPDNSFDYVTGFNSIQYAENVLHVLGEIKRVLKSKAKLAIGTWGSETECESLKVLSSIASLLPPPLPGTPGPLAFSDKGRLEHLLKQAGYTITDKSTIECPWNFSSLEDALKGILAAGPSAEAIRYAGKEKVKQKLTDTLQSFLYDEIYVLENVYHYYIAEKA